MPLRKRLKLLILLIWRYSWHYFIGYLLIHCLLSTILMLASLVFLLVHMPTYSRLRIHQVEVIWFSLSKLAGLVLIPIIAISILHILINQYGRVKYFFYEYQQGSFLLRVRNNFWSLLIWWSWSKPASARSNMLIRDLKSVNILDLYETRLFLDP